MKKGIENYLDLRIVTLFCITSVLITTAFGATDQNVRQSDYKADQVLKSNAKINPSTLALEFAIPIGGYAGRAGFGLPIVFNYSSKVWQVYNPPNSSWSNGYGIINDTRPLYAKRTAAGWSSSLGTPRIDYTLQIYEPRRYDTENYDGQVYTPVDSMPPPLPDAHNLYYIKRVQVTMPDGSSHEFRKDDTIYSYGTSTSPGGSGLPDLNGIFLSVDGSRMKLDLSEQSSILYLPDGSRYLFGPKGLGFEHKANAYIDPNGNKMTYDAANRRWTDSLGRLISDPMPSNWHEFEQNQTFGDVTAEFPGKGTGTYNVTFSWRYLKDPQGGESGLEDTSQALHYTSNKYCQGNLTHNVPGTYLFGNPESIITRVCAPGYNSADPPFNPIVLTKITLPNGQNYQFKYNVYGEITKIIYPTGAYEKFTYSWILPVQGSEASYEQANRGVSNRRISAKGDGTDEIQWNYTAEAPYPQPYTVTAIAPDGTKTQQYIYHEGPNEAQPYGFGDSKTGRSYEDRILSPGNQLLRRKLTKYITTGAQTGGTQHANRDMRPEKEISIIFEPGESYALATMTETVFDTNTDPQYFAELNAKQTKIYKYKVLSLTTAQTAMIDAIAALFSSSDLETVTEVDYLYDANYKARNINGLVSEIRIKDASGTIKAKSQISYDEPAYPVIDYGTTTNWENPNTVYRGKPTTTRSWTDIAANQYIETHAQYDNFGNLRKAWDGRGNMTETEYSAAYNYAYPTKVKTPKPDPSGTRGSNTELVTTSVYDFNTGLLTSTTDFNNQTTEIQYNDALLRPTKTIAPNGHQTITEYGAGTSEATRYVKVRTQIDGQNWKENYVRFDGLGRTVKTQTVDSAGDIFVETEFDNMSRPKKVTNPYRAGESVYWTENFYDDLSRIVKVKTPDNAEIETAYSLATAGSQIGTVVTVEDQANKLRRSISNSLGQLVRVDEPNESNQLGTVASPNQATFYGYDALNNLTTVTQGLQTRSFVYDSLSRLKSASNPESGLINYSYDGANNLTSKTDARYTTTNYLYDALNRVVEKSYTGETDYTTPTVSYFYDNLPNAKGKLIKVSNSFSTTEYLSFDSLGQPLTHRQMTDGQTFTTQYSYNLSGTLVEQTYPSGRVVKTSLDADGDLAKIESKKNAADYFRNYATSFVYTAAGAVSSLRLGNGKFENTVYNSRLQPVQIGLGASATSQNLLKLNFDYGTTDNNGNVKAQTITVPTIGNSQGFTAHQIYSYDSLNRLKQATETINNNQTPNWKQTFTYDRYGNRRFDEANTTTLIPNCPTAVCNPTIDPATNKLVGYQFDNAGNTKTDAENRTFIYDGENKQVEVKNASGTSIGKYFYDGDGKRVKKISLTETTLFIYDAMGQLISEYSTQLSNQPQVAFLTADHLGSPRINTNAAGQVISRHDYQPFGEEIARTNYGMDDVRKKFTGYERDSETNLDYAQARYYSNQLGRFTTVDPLMASARTSNPKTLNRYVYTLNNPLKYVDLDGMDVTVMDERSKELLLKTLPYEIREKVEKQIEKGKGTLKKDSLKNIKSDDKNFAALKTLADSKEITEVATSATGNGMAFFKTTAGGQREKDIQEYLNANPNKSRADAEKIYPAPSNPSEEYAYLGQTYSPNGEDNTPASPSGNLLAVTTDQTGDASTVSEEEAVVTMGHELYWHAYNFRIGNKTWKNEGAVVTAIEERTRKNYKDGEQKKNNPTNLKPKQ